MQLGQSNKHSLELEKLIFSVLKEQKNSKKKKQNTYSLSLRYRLKKNKKTLLGSSIWRKVFCVIG